MEEYVGLIIGLLFWGLTLGGVVYSWFKQGEAFEADLSAFAEMLEGGETERTQGILPTVTARGGLNGRQVEVSIFQGVLQYRVRLRGASGVALALSKDGLEAELSRWEGDGREDRHAQARAMAVALRELFGLLSFERIDVHDGWLQARRGLFDYGRSTESLRRVFSRLEAIAPLFESRAITVRVLGDAPVIGWLGGGSDVLCPYCRDGVDADSEDVAACDDCRTVHHRECMEEAGGCTVFGCRRAPQRQERA